MFARLDLHAPNPQYLETNTQYLQNKSSVYLETNCQYLEKVVLIWDIVYKYGNWRLETSHRTEILSTIHTHLAESQYLIGTLI